MPKNPCTPLYETWVKLVYQLDGLLKKLPESDPAVQKLYKECQAAEDAWRACLEKNATRR